MRKRLLIGCMAVIMGCMLAGCDARPHYADENNNDQITDFNQINEVLWYDSATKIVYYYPHGGVFLCPYISKDGQYCKYEDGKVVPLERGE
ncbi:hypothetical protein [Anaerostipes sp. Marseille-Q3525]|uniref:hypothetical protein n=1 Tax=Anaerostipes sp. Marseille-Q3525 TaxID=2758418 RepID=UPI001BA6E2B5|nr:hypothetical protein [Anaerostipes sp. Marseille-Q3525]